MKREELIGSAVTVKESRQEGIAGISGMVVDETAVFLVIDTVKGRKRVRKQGAMFLFNSQLLKGDEIAVAPEERIKVKQ